MREKDIQKIQWEDIGSGIEATTLHESYFVIKNSASAINYEYTDSVTTINSPKLKRNIVNWGENNDAPDQLIVILGKNPVASACIPFLIDVSFGSGVKVGTVVDGIFKEYQKSDFLNSKLKPVDDFFEDNDINTQIAELLSDLHWFSHGYIELILNKGGDKIVSFQAKEATYSRLEQANPKTGIIEHHAYSAKWADGPKTEDVDVSFLLNTKSPSQDLLRRIGRIPYLDGKIKADNQSRYIFPIRISTPGKQYYPKPYYMSAVDSGWVDFANAIPEYKKAFMENSMSIKYIIEISSDYFKRIFNEEGLTTKKEMEARKKKELENINSFLKGTKAAGKSMITYKRVRAGITEEIPEVKINVLNTKIGGEYIEDSQEASTMIYTAFRVHPSLIGVIPGKTTSNLSGSDKRELLIIAQSLQGRIRHAILKPLYTVKKVNNWPEELVFAIGDIILTTKDSNEEATQKTVV